MHDIPHEIIIKLNRIYAAEWGKNVYEKYRILSSITSFYLINQRIFDYFHSLIFENTHTHKRINLLVGRNLEGRYLFY